MIQESRFTLNQRVSLFRHNGGVYLFDPATRTCASMNEDMLALFAEPHESVELRDGLTSTVADGVMEAIAQLRRLGILVESKQEAHAYDSCGTAQCLSLMTHLTIFVTTKCNLRCAYCYARGGETEKTISRETWSLAMDHFFASLDSGIARERKSLKNVNLTIHGGGESTLEFATLKGIVASFCDRARAMGLTPAVGMGTNGTYTGSVHQWIVDNNITVNISLDGPRAVQNRLRPFRSGEPSYDVVVGNLERLVKTGRPVSIRATITDEAVETMEETIELARQLGLAAVNFQPVTLTGRCANSSIARPDAERFAEKFLKCFLLGLEHDIDVKYSGFRCFEPYHRRFCSACGQNFCVTPDGNITTCYEVLDDSDPAAGIFFIGKIDPERGQVEWDQSRIRRLERRAAANMDACRGCFLRYQCAGDCPIKSFRYSGHDIYSPDPYRCQIAGRINKQLIAWLADGVFEPRNSKQAGISTSILV